MLRPSAASLVLALSLPCAVGCGGADSAGAGGATEQGGAGPGAGTGAGGPGSTGRGGAASTGTDAGSGGGAASSGTGTATGGGSGTGGGGGAPAATCDLPIQPVDTSGATNKVGDGTPGSCTEGALATAVAQGGAVVFDCGGPITIALTQTITLPSGVDTTIDGGGVVTIDGGGATRLFMFDSANFRATTTVYAFQHLTLAHGKSTGTQLPQAPPPCSQGFDLDAGGAAIWIRDGVLHVVDVVFDGNEAATPGPDVAGGGVYTLGSLDTTIVGSVFRHNSGANGGAIGSLNSDLTLVNDVFEDNHALGSGANYIDGACGVNGGESGDGGNGGAVSIDGGSDGALLVCGATFTGNSCHAFGGAIFRTPDGPQQPTTIDRCTFDGNSTDAMDDAGGGGALYFHNSALTITASTLANNTSRASAGALQADSTDLTLENDTFAGNAAETGLGGAVAIFSNGGVINGCTFADNHADGGFGLFGAALAGNTTFSVDNSIFSNDTSMDCGAPMACAIQGSGQGDVQFPATHVVCASADPPCGGAAGTTFADPGLAPLGDNGGPTKTQAPAASGPAAGAGSSCLPTDQRGLPRPADGCTAGAYQL